ncbi:sulfotransferase family 2 domain-containing protein [Sedimentitalea nanhaiensis]|uniref:Sulfotransferase family protein n=1 Tax=Sedimentitalea nanhaiensis TaxID=999627 RepID=A0A1I7C8T7_9RHOB|nr:sulfotransferase family 2 domain-containing protein [Sedimentitalea nanhaiensis]SFT95784.1 Sulfotransferase family protein [Sedimentitalea nanhaiensis]
MSGPFDYFVLFAEMRTGSNFLESNLNALGDVACFGEAFNPHFIGYPNRAEILGITREERDAAPEKLIAAIRDVPGTLGGFRYFHDHDPRVLDRVLNDPRCGKIVLTRNPLDSYVSWNIARATGQWKLTNVKRRKDARVAFDPIEFSRHVQDLQAFQVTLLNRLQRSGQTGFYVAYEDLQDVAVMNGLARWLGAVDRLERLDTSLKRQNPGAIGDKVSNPEEMAAALGGLDRFNLTRTPSFEPRRGAAIPFQVAAAQTPLLYMPVRGGPEAAIARWLAALDGGSVADLTTGMNQKRLRQWKRKHPNHRSFTVLRHPLARAHAVFCSCILSTEKVEFSQIRETLRSRFRLKIPKGDVGTGYTVQQHRAAFEAFLEFARASISGQTAIRLNAAWATQSSALAGFSGFAQPDFVLREEELPEMVQVLARLVGRDVAPPVPETPQDTPFALSDIHDQALEALVADVYQRDYMMFGFGPWRAA